MASREARDWDFPLFIWKIVVIEYMLLKKFTQRLSDNRKKIFFNIFWAVTGKIVNMAGALFVGILVARYLGPSQYGLMI